VDVLVLENFLSSSVRMATPLLIAALGLSISERSGVMNIGVEGMMLMAAFGAYVGAKLASSYWLGLLVGVTFALVTILIFAITTITYKANQVIVGTAINILSTGLSSFLYRWIFYGTGRLDEGIAAKTFPIVEIPLLSKIPVIGKMLFSQNIIVYFGLVMTVILWVVIYKTSLGLKITAVGDHPKAAESVGIDVIKVRYLAVLFSGILIGVAGTFLSIAQSSSFGEEMTAGRGFIAMAVIILGKWNPVGALGGALVFGTASALQMFFQTLGVEIPTNLIMMVPYIATVIAVLLLSKHRVGKPRALGIPY
jgi:ABC-type uncharacterized transport system permease subunit